jgi:sigma-B regulation protein RsbU (phosphoserine phosphatase)
MVYGVIDRFTGEGRIAIAGHPPPMVIRHGGGIDSLDTGGLPVGMFDTAAYEAQPFHLGPGDRIVMYSDGITECFDSEGEAFELERFQQALLADRSSSATAVLANVEARVRDWRGNAPLDDDISVFMIERPVAE